MSRSFKSKAENIDFSQSHEASDAINKWVEDQTNNKIQNLITPDSLNDDTMMILVNTIYFKGIWKYKFKSTDYNDKPLKHSFFISNTESVNVDFMQMSKYLYFENIRDLKVQALRLPYRDSDIEMLILLPNEQNGLSELEGNLMNFDISDLWVYMREWNVEVKLPKFKIEFEADLNEPLKKVIINISEYNNSPYVLI